MLLRCGFKSWCQLGTSSLQSVYQLLPADLSFSHSIHALKHPFQTLPVLIHAGSMNLQLPVLQQLPGQFPEGLRELEILGLGLHLAGAHHKELADDRVRERPPHLDVRVELLDVALGNREERGVRAGFGR